MKVFRPFRIINIPILLVYALSFFSCTNEEKRDIPNVVIIFIDDLGYADIGSYGAIDYATPELDRMAAEGMRFTSFYAAQGVCSASRAAILTGCYPKQYPPAPYSILLFHRYNTMRQFGLW